LPVIGSPLTGASLGGAGIGLLGGLGLALIVAWLPVWRRPSLEDRLAPYVSDAVPRSALLAVQPGVGRPALLERFLAPVMADATGWLERASAVCN